MRTQRTIGVGVFLAALSAFGSSSLGASHSWRVNEVFSNADGTIQFVELKECCGFSGEHGLLNKDVKSDGTGNAYVFPANLPLADDTSDRHILLATAAFAALPGAPTPDHVLPANFFVINGDTLRYATILGYDVFTYGAAVLPTNGIDSIQLTSFSPDTFITAPNTPTNYAGVPGSVDASGCSDNDTDGYGDPGHPSCSAGPETDCDDGDMNVNPGATELCNDTIDNDCDGDTDCDDSDCASDLECLARLPGASTWSVLVSSLLVLIVGTVAFGSRRAGRAPVH